MKRVITILALSSALFLSGCQKKDEKKMMPSAVSVMEIKPQEVNLSIGSTATTEASKYVQIRARVDGYLNSIDYKEGSFVHAGENMFRLDPRPLEASFNMAKAAQSSAEASYQNAKRNLERAKPISEANAMSKQEFDNAVSAEAVAKATYENTTAQVALAQLNLSYTYIKSPVNGLSDRSQVHIGNYIAPTQNGLLTTVSQIDPIYVNFQLSENQYLALNQPSSTMQKNSVKITLSDGKDFAFKGKLDFCSPSFDSTTGTMSCRAEVKNPEGKLRPGEFVRVSFAGNSLESAVTIPQKALLQGQKGRFVYVIKDEKAVPTPVVLGDWVDDKIVILQGLKAGDKLAVEGIAKVMPNSPVKIVSDTNSSGSQK